MVAIIINIERMIRGRPKLDLFYVLPLQYDYGWTRILYMNTWVSTECVSMLEMYLFFRTTLIRE